MNQIAVAAPLNNFGTDPKDGIKKTLLGHGTEDRLSTLNATK